MATSLGCIRQVPYSLNLSRLFAFPVFLPDGVSTVYCVPTVAVTEADDENDSEWDEDEESSEADDDGRVYKNPRNSPSTECPRDEEQATLLVSPSGSVVPLLFVTRVHFPN